MANLRIKVTRAGKPVPNAEVFIGHLGKGLTNAEGRAEKTLPGSPFQVPVVMPIVIKGEGFQMGIANALLEADTDYVVEV